MLTSVQAITAAAQKVPGYCTSGIGIHTPQQWKTCWKLGYQQPTTGAATAGHFTGHTISPLLIGALIGLVIIFLISRGRSRTPATN